MNNQEVLNEFNDLLQKYNLTLQIDLDFPIYKVLPVEVQLALAVINKHGVEYKITFKDNKPNSPIIENKLVTEDKVITENTNSDINLSDSELTDGSN